MSRLGRKTISLPGSVKLSQTGQVLSIAGPKGILEVLVPGGVTAKEEEGLLSVKVSGKSKKMRISHGTTRALIANAVKGVTEGWSKTLELVGTGFRAETTGALLTMALGFSHPVKVEAPEGISFKVEKTDVTIEGIDRELVGLTAERIRKIRPPEPYKGKGIKYKDEVIRRKAGKAAKAQATAA
jgi:large subunit ribosomal protein L6